MRARLGKGQIEAEEQARARNLRGMRPHIGIISVRETLLFGADSVRQLCTHMYLNAMVNNDVPTQVHDRVMAKL